MKAKLFLILTSLVFALFLAELLARLLIGTPASILYSNSFRDRQTDWDIVYGVDSGKHRKPCVQWDGKTSRVAIIGDSFVFGQGVSDCRDFPSLLNLEANQRLYVNLGVIGIGPNEYLQIAKNMVDSNYRDVVLLFYGNDWLDRPPTLTQLVIAHSSLLSLIRRVWRERIVSGAIEEAATTSKPWNNIEATIARNPDYACRMVNPDGQMRKQFENTFKQIILVLKENVGKEHIYVAMAPAGHTVSRPVREHLVAAGGCAASFGREGKAYTQLRRLSIETGLHFIDIWPAFLANGSTLYHPHDFHWNAAGHRQMAKLLRQAIH